MSNGNGKGPGSKHKKVKLKRPTSLNYERDKRLKDKITKLNLKKDKRILEEKGTKLIDRRIKRLKKRIKGKARNAWDQTWG